MTLTEKWIIASNHLTDVKKDQILITFSSKHLSVVKDVYLVIWGN
jgi:hypothetical protein